MTRSKVPRKAIDAEVNKGKGSSAPHPPTSPSLATVESVAGVETMESMDTPVSAFERTEVSWLWPNRIALGKLAVVEGMPGLGKSTVLLELAARVTTGRAMPECDENTLPPSAVYLMSAEDGVGDTIRPRLEAAGANIDLVFVPPDDGSADKLNVGDIEKLRDVIVRRGVKLLAVDPVTAFLPKGISANDEGEIRSVLKPLARLAASTGCAIVVIRHWRKSGAGTAMNQGAGSIGIIAQARTALVACALPDDPSLVVLAVVKSNIGPKPLALKFRVVGDPEFNCARVEWHGTTDITADSLVTDTFSDPQERVEISGAKGFLLDLLAHGNAMLVSEIEAAGEKAEYSYSTLDKAARKLRVIRERHGYQGPASWMLPAHTLHTLHSRHSLHTQKGGEEVESMEEPTADHSEISAEPPATDNADEDDFTTFRRERGIA